MRVSLKNLKISHHYYDGPAPNIKHILVIAGGKEIIRVSTWVAFAAQHARVSMFGSASGYGNSAASRESAIYEACEDAGVVFQGDPRDNIRITLRKLARAKGYRGKILILEV